MFSDAGGQIVEEVPPGGGTALGAGVDALAVIVVGIDGAVGGDAGDAALRGEAVVGGGGCGAEALADLGGGAEEGKGGGRGDGGAENVGGRGRRVGWVGAVEDGDAVRGGSVAGRGYA